MPHRYQSVPTDPRIWIKDSYAYITKSRMRNKKYSGKRRKTKIVFLFFFKKKSL